MPSFYIPLTALQSDTTALDTIANNLANMNTAAFKSQTVNFSDLFYQQIGSSGSGDPIQVGAGVQVASIDTDFTPGAINSTGTATDVALSGAGFFVLSDGSSQELTRAGNFSIDSSGNLIAKSGLAVMGYPAANGVVNTNAPLTGINIPVGAVQQPEATTSFGMTANLNADSQSAAAFPAQVTIYDSLGVSHVATVSYNQTGNGTWNYSIALPASDFTSGSCTAVTGSLGFDSSGNLSTVTPSGGSATTVGTGAGDTSSIAVGFSGLADGSANLDMKWNLLGTSGTPTISQVATASSVTGTVQDGHSSGQYQDFSVGPDGTVTAKFSNGQNMAVGQLALANVANVQGLEKLGNGNYATSLASGTATIGMAGSSGLGKLQGGALEQSNVNISEQFSDLIIAQRAFEASSKAVTTFDTVTQTTINMIH